MDSEWVGRVGILAAGISPFLIAPEIIGIERLRRVERAMQKWQHSNADSSLVFFGVVLAVPILVVLAIKYPLVQMALQLPILAEGAVLALVAVLALLALFVGLFLTDLLLLLLGLAKRLVTAPDRLRALVFGTGVFLLFGGLGAQFAGTF